MNLFTFNKTLPTILLLLSAAFVGARNNGQRELSATKGIIDKNPDASESLPMLPSDPGGVLLEMPTDAEDRKERGRSRSRHGGNSQISAEKRIILG
eukprot:5966052-Ditylum_brightwellii.AAC.1